MPDIFISYSRDDQATARRFAEGFERAGLNVWWDQSLDPGDAYDHVTEKALKEAKAVVVLWSKKSVDSRWVRAEATLANRNHTLVPAMIEACDRPIMFELTHTVDLSHWKGDPNDNVWQTYVAGVRKFVKKDAPESPLSVKRPAIDSRKRFKSVAITISVATLVVVGAVLWAVYREPGFIAKPAAPKEVTLAVLPFLDLSPGKDQEYFSDGLSEEILNQAAQIEGLMVTARTSSFSFKGKNVDMRVIGEKLGVSNLLEGSIRKDGNDLRITAQLINAGDNSHIWSHTYAREMTKILEVQDEIAKDVAKALRIKLDVGDMPRAKGGTTNLEAYDNFLRALAATQKLDFMGAHKYSRQATALDPDFLAAWVSDFNLLTFILPYDEARMERLEIQKRIDAAAAGSWQAFFIRASIQDFDQKWFEMKAAYEAAYVAADKEKSKRGRAMIASYDAHRLRKTGDVSGAQELWEPLAEANPVFLGMSEWLYKQLFSLGRTAEGLTELDRSKTLPGYQGGGDIELLTELRFRKNVNPATIWNQYDALLKRAPLLQNLFTVQTDPNAAKVMLHKAFDETDNPRRARSERIALWADYFGDKDLALAAMKRGLTKETFDGFPLPSLWYPYATGLRGDPRFKEIVRTNGLADYWRRTGEWGDFCKPIGTDDFECH